MDEIIENTLANRFAWMMKWFCEKIAAEACMQRMEGKVAVAAYGRFARLGQRFVALIEHWQAGTLPAVVPARPRVAVVRVAKPRAPGLLARGFSWFRKLFPITSVPL